MIQFYKDKGTHAIRPELFSKDMERLAEKLSGQGDRVNKRTQIRKFYDEVVRLNALAKASADDWNNVLPYVHMLVAKAAYAEGRELVSTDFVDFIRDSVGQIDTGKDLDVFANAFEAFMGFYRKYRPRDN